MAAESFYLYAARSKCLYALRTLIFVKTRRELSISISCSFAVNILVFIGLLKFWNCVIIPEPHLLFKNKLLILRVAEKALEILSNAPKSLTASENSDGIESQECMIFFFLSKSQVYLNIIVLSQPHPFLKLLPLFSTAIFRNCEVTPSVGWTSMLFLCGLYLLVQVRSSGVF